MKPAINPRKYANSLNVYQARMEVVRLIKAISEICWQCESNNPDCFVLSETERIAFAAFEKTKDHWNDIKALKKGRKP